MESDASVVGVLGASGGLGASTLAVAMAVRAARQGWRAVVVDGQLARGGVDVTACVEHLPGLRWTDLSAAEGPMDGPRLIGALPSDGGPAVLSAGPPGAALPPVSVVGSTVAALASCTDVVVVDLPSSVGDLASWLPLCIGLVVVFGLTPRGLADAEAACQTAVTAVTRPWLVARAERRQQSLAERAARHLGLPLAGLMPSRSDIRVAADRGVPPGTGGRGGFGDLAVSVLRDVLGERPAPRAIDLRAS
jgi:hypothetical protein